MKFLVRFFGALACLFLLVVAMFIITHRERRPQIYFAVERGDINAIAKYLSLGSNANTPILSYPYGGNRDVPLLDIAVQYRKVEAIAFLIKNGANPNQPDCDGRTPLQWAVNGRTDEMGDQQLATLKALIDGGADPNRPDSYGNHATPLMNAVWFGNMPIVKALLAAGASVKATNQQGETPLHFAETADMARLLIERGADPKELVGGELPTQTAARFLTNAATGKH